MPSVPSVTKAFASRSVRREGATADLAAAKEAGNAEDIEKYSKRTVRVTREHNEECRRLLQLMGVPVLEVCNVSGFTLKLTVMPLIM